MFYGTNGLFAQNWAIGGNPNADVPAGGGRLGTNGDRSVIFETNNTERARLLNGNGFWGFGTTAPNSQVHINSPAGTDALRVQVNGASKLFVHNGGGVSIGTSSIPPANGLLVSGSIGVGTSTPAVKLHVVNGSDASPGGGGFIVSGYTSGGNIAIDDNEIMARNNGAASTLFLNDDGGDVNISAGGLFLESSTNFVGVGTTAPAVDLHLVHGVGSGVTHGLRLRNNGGNNEDWTFYVNNAGGDLFLYANGSLLGSFNDATGAYSALSDIRRKKDIEKAPDIMDKVLTLDVKKYHMLESAPSDKKRYGLIAQEAEKVFPEAVTHIIQDDGSDIYTLDYSVFGIIAIKALQEQQKKITTLEERIAKLEAAINAGANSNNISKETGSASLEQNMPNPFNHATTIRYHIPQNASAMITIYNGNGVPVKTVKANDSGIATIQANELSAGTYTYNLVVNGRIAASKKMVLLK
jgi:hypothetical protein